MDQIYLYSFGYSSTSIFIGINISDDYYIIYDNNDKLKFREIPSMLLVNSTIHFFGMLENIDDRYPRHFIWDFDKNDIKLIHNFGWGYGNMFGFKSVYINIWG